ncbi:MAG: L-histidine N(alpha)-methyltransferase [Actinobacteria bacterium]|nr:L-histidine N(alpha)-methyltransferase [Actinomycetota bacterium]
MTPTGPATLARAPEPAVDVHLTPEDLAQALRDDVAAGLAASPKHLPPKWFYDDRGSELFDDITRLPEYYPTRREREVLLREAPAIVARSRADVLVELGSGTSEKTITLIETFAEAGRLRAFVPFDVCEGFLRRSAQVIATAWPGTEVHGVVGDFERHVDRIPCWDGSRRLVAFLGGTIGNLEPADRARFLANLATSLRPGDALLLGTDLVKDPERLVRAYDDAQGVTAEFNRNVLRVLNRELDANFDPDRFTHVARWDPESEWIEMRLRANGDHHVVVGALDLVVELRDGEEIRTEISAKFRRERVEAELAGAGFVLEDWWTDRRGDFAVSLARLV